MRPQNRKIHTKGRPLQQTKNYNCAYLSNQHIELEPTIFVVISLVVLVLVLVLLLVVVVAAASAIYLLFYIYIYT